MTLQKPNPKRNDQNSWKPGNDWAMSLNHGKVITWKWLNEWSEQLNNLFKKWSQKQSHWGFLSMPSSSSMPPMFSTCCPTGPGQSFQPLSWVSCGPNGDVSGIFRWTSSMFFLQFRDSGTQSWCTWHHLSRREMNWTLDRVVVWFKRRPMTYGREYHSMV